MRMFNRSNVLAKDANIDNTNVEEYNLIKSKEVELDISVEARRDMNGIYYFNYYHPWHGGSNPDFDDISEELLDLKRRRLYAIDNYYKKLKGALYKSFIYFKKHNMINNISIVEVPSHAQGHHLSSMEVIAERLAKCYGITNASSCLVRTSTINKLANGGCRNQSVHLNSIEVFNEELIKNKKVILLDDITTTGNSLLACKRLLMENGAESNVCIAMGKTV